MLLFGEAFVELCGQGVFACCWCGRGSEGWEGGEGGGGSEGAEDLAAAEELPVEGSEERIHGGIFSERAGKGQRELAAGVGLLEQRSQ